MRVCENSFESDEEEDETLPSRLRMLAICCLLSSAAMAQPLSGTGSITGIVRDVSGALVTEAHVEVRNPDQGVKRETTTDSHGTFSVIALEPASGYVVGCSENGFAD